MYAAVVFAVNIIKIDCSHDWLCEKHYNVPSMVPIQKAQKIIFS